MRRFSAPSAPRPALNDYAFAEISSIQALIKALGHAAPPPKCHGCQRPMTSFAFTGTSTLALSAQARRLFRRLALRQVRAASLPAHSFHALLLLERHLLRCTIWLRRAAAAYARLLATAVIAGSAGFRGRIRRRHAAIKSAALLIAAIHFAIDGAISILFFFFTSALDLRPAYFRPRRHCLLLIEFRTPGLKQSKNGRHY